MRQWMLMGVMIAGCLSSQGFAAEDSLAGLCKKLDKYNRTNFADMGTVEAAISAGLVGKIVPEEDLLGDEQNPTEESVRKLVELLTQLCGPLSIPTIDVKNLEDADPKKKKMDESIPMSGLKLTLYRA